MAQYLPLDQTDPEKDPRHVRINNPWLLRARNWIISLLAIYGVVNLGGLLWSQLPTKKHVPCSCGQTPAEAIARGCKFDPFALAWLPDACRDDELIMEFEELGKTYNHSWKFYTWPNPDRELTLPEISKMADVVGMENVTRAVVTTTVDWHHTHCLYLWRKLYRTRYTNIVMESRYDAEHHQKHCVESILEWVRAQSPADQPLGGSVIDLYSDTDLDT